MIWYGKTALFIQLFFSCCLGFTDREIDKYRNDIKKMFYHAYDGYMKFAFPYDELRPLTCDGHDTWGSYSLTLIDALDTLGILGNDTEFRRVHDIILEKADFDIDINVSVFETNIRIIGGLLSAHLMCRRMGVTLDEFWPCKGPMLQLAIEVADRLLPAFDTPTGMPYGTINLRDGVPVGETPIACAACVGTFIVEFGTLSRLTGNPIYEEVALRAMHALWNHRSSINLLGNHIDVQTGKWTAQDSGIGAGIDSFFEYLVKGAVLFQRPELMAIFNDARKSFEKYLKYDDWYLWATMTKGQVTLAVFQSLEAYWPGLLTLIGDVESAQRSLYNYHQVWKQFGFTPEFYNIPKAEPSSKREGYPLRPEFVESLVYLYQATKDQNFLKMGADVLTSINHSAKTKCGYATVKNVINHSLDNRMESFFLAETTKYLYLLFNKDHWIHNTGSKGKIFRTKSLECIIESGAYIFNTEAHPIDPGALHCCMKHRKEEGYYIPEEDILSLLTDPFQSFSKSNKLNVLKAKTVNFLESASKSSIEEEFESSCNEDNLLLVNDNQANEENSCPNDDVKIAFTFKPKHSLVSNLLRDKSEIKETSDQNVHSFAVNERVDKNIIVNKSGMEDAPVSPSVSSSKYATGSIVEPHIMALENKIVNKPRTVFHLQNLQQRLNMDRKTYLNFTINASFSLLSCPHPSFSRLYNAKGQMVDHDP